VVQILAAPDVAAALGAVAVVLHAAAAVLAAPVAAPDVSVVVLYVVEPDAEQVEVAADARVLVHAGHAPGSDVHRYYAGP